MAKGQAERDTETAGAILDAAEPLFAQQGFAATTIKQIGAAAGVNPALIYYWFGSKDELYRELLRRLFTNLAGRGSERLAAAPSPQAAVRALLGVQSAAEGGGKEHLEHRSRVLRGLHKNMEGVPCSGTGCISH